MADERWVTDDDLAAARHRFGDAIQGWQPPVAYAVARVEDTGLVFGHVNEPGGQHRLPAVVLATVCGHASGTATYDLTSAQLAEAVRLLAPAEAATHWEHPNLWSWRGLLSGVPEDRRYVAMFVGDVDDEPVDDRDAELRRRLRRA
jgi:hypothetical protein